MFLVIFTENYVKKKQFIIGFDTKQIRRVIITSCQINTQGSGSIGIWYCMSYFGLGIFFQYLEGLILKDMLIS
ncbi:hypothetical protein BpHYR1_038145 [Brachionus plicatilis]|uniref:Uncharacterized protein n=1 Tax=Brachionus plicatilis TaxID=10195 RepID=A0A3M7Q9B9_BRAPC|nr:hypothetical protein BpHYR1_038145 [Brachionus plicatilis]